MASIVKCFRADQELSALMENQAYLDGTSESELLDTAVRLYLRYPPSLRLRRHFEALLTEVLVGNAFLRALVEQTFGEKEVASEVPKIEREAIERARLILANLEENSD